MVAIRIRIRFDLERKRQAQGVAPRRERNRRRSPTVRLDSAAPTGDRLRAIEQIESRALGKPKETVETVDGKTEVDEALDRMATEDLEALVQRGRELRLVQSEAAEH